MKLSTRLAKGLSISNSKIKSTRLSDKQNQRVINRLKPDINSILSVTHVYCSNDGSMKGVVRLNKSDKIKVEYSEPMKAWIYSS